MLTIITQCKFPILFSMASQKMTSYNDKVKHRDELTVSGYVRETEKNVFSYRTFYHHVPATITSLCGKYYHIARDKFHQTLHGDKMMVTDVSVQLTLGDVAEHFESAFLSNIMNSGEHHWRFCLLTKVETPLVYVGVWKCNDYDPHDALNDTIYQNEKHGDNATYALNLGFGELRGCIDETLQEQQYCPEYKTGDIIDMYLDLNVNELRYSINDKDFGKAFNVEQTSYIAVIGMIGGDSMNKGWDATIQLLEYETK